ncbi:MAG: hypothetical protein AAGN35_08600 [Bacteroidota bacterium]
MTTSKRFFYLKTSVLLVCLGLGSFLFGQTSTSFKVTGPCVNCGAAYLENAVLKITGVKSAHYDAGNFMLSLQYDAASASEIDIQLELSGQGFDAGDFAHDDNAQLPACARWGSTRGDLEALGMNDVERDDAANWENPQNLAELEVLGQRGDDDADIGDEVLFEEESDNEEELINWEPVNIEDEEDGNF